MDYRIVLVVFSGRPLELSWEAENMDAILYAWHPGTKKTFTCKLSFLILDGYVLDFKDILAISCIVVSNLETACRDTMRRGKHISCLPVR